jgi:hypothetical protein
VAGTQDDSWSGHHLSSVCLAAKPSHVGADVDGSACCLHRPTNCGWQSRTQSLLTGTIMSHRTIETGVASPWGVNLLRVDTLSDRRLLLGR